VASGLAVLLATNVAVAAGLSGLVSAPTFFPAVEALDLVSPLPGPPQGEGYQALANYLQIELVNEANRLFRATPGWQCITAGTSSKADVQVSPMLQQFLEVGENGVVAYDGERIEQPANTPNAAAWRVGLELNVAGRFTRGGAGVSSRPAARTVYDPGFLGAIGPLIDIREALLSALSEELQEAVRGSGAMPCNPKIRVRGKVTGRAAGGRSDDQFDGQTRLTLDENGSFQASFPFSASATWTISTRTLSCSGEGTSEGTLDLAGSYDGVDALRVSRMGFQQTGGRNVTNCPGLETVQVVSQDMAEAAGLRLVLADGTDASASATLAEGVVREMRFELSYEADQSAAIIDLSDNSLAAAGSDES